MSGSSRAQFPRETSERGAFVRQDSAFRDRVTADGSSGYQAVVDRYHLYVSLACPWAHRAVIVRRLKQLEDAVGLTVVDPIRDERGWRFGDGPGFSEDPLYGFRYLAEAYHATDPSFDGRVTVPVLWDKQRRRIVNNESSEIIRMLNSEFDGFGDAGVDLYPAEHRAEIDAVNDRVYGDVNNGVYCCGFASTQEAYDEAYGPLFDTLDWLDRRLADRDWLVGDRMTEADIRLFTTLIRFDPVYYVHFKCNGRLIRQYDHLGPYVDRVFHVPGIAETVNLDHIRRHYFETHTGINPYGIVPGGPQHPLPD